MKDFEKFTEGIKVRVDGCYLTDESTEHTETSEFATVVAEVGDEDQLVGIQYESGIFDYVPQNILEIV